MKLFKKEIKFIQNWYLMRAVILLLFIIAEIVTLILFFLLFIKPIWFLYVAISCIVIWAITKTLFWVFYEQIKINKEGIQIQSKKEIRSIPWEKIENISFKTSMFSYTGEALELLLNIFIMPFYFEMSVMKKQTEENNKYPDRIKLIIAKKYRDSIIQFRK